MSYTYAGRFGPEALIDLQGNVQLGVVVAVYQTDGSPAVLYTNRLKSGTLPNSTSPNALGNLTFFADPGDYDLVAGSTTVRVTVGADPAETAHGGVTDPHADRAYTDGLIGQLDTRIDDLEAGGGGGGDPTGAAGGDLDGTYPDPTIGAGKVGVAELEDGAITNAKISNSAAIAASKLAGVGVLASSNTWTADNYFRSGRPWVDVRAYGAAGSGGGDDTAAIQAAIDAAEVLKAAVYLPPGIYPITGLTIDSRMTMFGAGKQKTTLTAKAGSVGPLIDADFAVMTGKAISVGGFTIDLGSARTIVGLHAHNLADSWLHDIEIRYGSDGIYLELVQQMIVEQITASNQTHAGVRVKRPDGDTHHPNIMLRDIWVNTPDETVTMENGVLIEDILAGATLSNIQVLANVNSGGPLLSGISILNEGFDASSDGHFIFLTNCQTDYIAGPGLHAQNVKGLWATNNFFGSRNNLETPGVRITGGKEIQICNNWISGRGVELYDSPDKVVFTANTIPQRDGDGAFWIDEDSPPTNLILNRNYYWTNPSNNLELLGNAAPDLDLLPLVNGIQVLTDSNGQQPGLLLRNTTTDKRKTLRVERGATGTLGVYNDADDLAFEVGDDGPVTLHRPSSSKKRTLSLTGAGALQVLANDGTTVTAEISDTGALTSGLTHAHQIIVAASNATTEVKARATYVCDGTADEVQIMAAAAVVEAAGGGKVILSEGTFNIDARMQKAGSGSQRFWTKVAIEGQGRGTVLLNRIDGGGVSDEYLFYVWGANAGAPIIGGRIAHMALTGQEYLANTKGQHGISVHWSEGFSFDDLYFESLSEEGIVLDEGAKYVQGGRIFGRNLGSAVIDMAGCEHVSVDEIQAVDTCQVEDSASVLIFDGSTAGRIPKHISIGKINSLRPGNTGLWIVSAEDVNVGQVVVVGATTGTRKTAHAVRVTKGTSNPVPKNIQLGQVIARSCGAKANDANLRATDATYLNVQQFTSEGSYGAAVALTGVTQSHFGQVTVHDPTDEGQAATSALEVNGATTLDNTFDQIVVRGWTWANGNGAGISCTGTRNIFGMVQVSGDGVVTGADWWDVSFGAGSVDNILESAILSGHGSGKITDAGTGNQLGRVIAGTNGATYKPYQAGGTGTIASGATTVDITHGLAFTPAARDIRLTPTNNLGAAAQLWVSNLGATTFRVNSDADPAADATFEWSASKV